MGGGAKKGLKEATNNLDDGIKKVGKEIEENITKRVIKFRDLAKTGFINPNYIRFSQNSISAKFKDGSTIQDLVQNLQNGTIDPKSIPAIRIVEKDGLIYTLDNRKLKAFQETGIDIPYEKLDKIPEEEIFKFTTKNEGVTIKIRGNG